MMVNGNLPDQSPDQAPDQFPDQSPNQDRAQPATSLTPAKVKPRFQFNLRAKATLLAVALSTLPIAMIGGGGYFVASRSLEQSAFDNQQLKAQEILDKINQFVAARYADIQLMANLPMLQSPIVRQAMSSEEQQAVLNQYRDAYRVYDSIVVADLKGKPILATSGKVPASVKDRDYFQTVLKTDQPIVSKIQFASGDGDASIVFAAPVKERGTGQTIAVIQATMPLYNLSSLVKVYSDETKEFRIFDQENKIVLATHQQELGRSITDFFKQLPPVQQKWQSTALRTTRADTNADNLVGLTVTESVEGMSNLGWRLAYSWDTADAFQTQYQLARTIALGTIATTALVVALSTLLIRRTLKPLEAAAKAVEQIGQGNLTTRLQVARQDELGVLASNINGMATRLQDLVIRQTRSAELAAVLNQIVSNARQSLQRSDILNTIALELRQALQADRVVLYFFTDGFHRGKIEAESVDAGWRQLVGEEIEDGCSTEIESRYASGTVRVITNVDAEPLSECHRKMLENFQVRASVVAAIIQNDKLMGLLCVHQCVESRDWTEEEVDLVRRLAVQVGFALDQAYLLQYTEQARQEARREADERADQQQKEKEFLQKRALELLMEVDPVNKGDLTVRAQVTPDEVGTIADSYNSIIGSLRQLVVDVQTASQTVAITASGNESSVQQLSAEAHRQMDAITQALLQVHASVESIQGVAQRAAEAEQGVQQANQTILAGDQAMNRTVEGILTIRETVAETAKKVKRLGEASQKISKVVNLISGFAAQTNLLALNAAIEAARAGEEGRGFAVVAEEVRSLAQQSAAATADIEQLVEEIQAQTNEVVVAMESGTDQVVMGTQLVEETREKLNDIRVVSARIDRLIKEITQATTMQTQVYETVSQAMEQVAGIADDSSKQSETVAESFGQLLEVAQALQVSVSQFKVS
jgi:methyl-accepting chemotaxis protein